MTFASQKGSPSPYWEQPQAEFLLVHPSGPNSMGQVLSGGGAPPPGKALSVRQRTPRESHRAGDPQRKPRCFWKLQDEVTKWLNFLTEF